MEVNWNCKEIKVAMGDMKFSVYPEFGCPKTRVVQGIVSRFGGLAWIYTEFGGSKLAFPHLIRHLVLSPEMDPPRANART